MNILLRSSSHFREDNRLSEIMDSVNCFTLKACLSPSGTESSSFWWSHYSRFNQIKKVETTSNTLWVICSLRQWTVSKIPCMTMIMYNHQIPLMTGSYSKESQNISTGVIHHSKIWLKAQKSAFQRTTQTAQKHPLLFVQPAIILSNLIKDGMWKSATVIILSTFIQNKFGFNHFETNYIMVVFLLPSMFFPI
jgi:hypothetical protein